MDQKALVLKFIKRQKLAVIATVGHQNKPEAAVLEFGQTNKLELIFDALESSRKVQNIRQNNGVAFVIGWDEDITVQYEGEAFELAGEELAIYKKLYWQKNPGAQKWEKVPGIKFFKVVSKWIRYSDLNKQPWEVFEVEDF